MDGPRIDSLTIRRHPDLFTADEALQYLHLSGEADRTLETLREKHQLIGQKVGRALMYHRRHLDSLIDRLFGIS